MKKKLLTGIGIIGLGVVLLSFVHGNEPQMKRYEVIRSVNGEVSVYDTLVPASSTFTPEDYLARLGFEDDEHIQIIQLPSAPGHQLFTEQGISPADYPMPPDHSVFMMHGISPHGIVIDSAMIMHIDAMHNPDSMMIMHLNTLPCNDSALMIKCIGLPGADSVFAFSINMNDEAIRAHHQQMMIERSFIIKQMDSLDAEIAEIEKMIEIHLSDSLFGSTMHGPDDSVITMMHTLVMDDPNAPQPPHHFDHHALQGEPDFERYMEKGNMKAHLRVYGEQENFTLVLVSDGFADMHKSQGLKTEAGKTPESTLKLYPNPANKEVSLQLNFDTKAATSVTVTDANGRVVMQSNLGELEGTYNQTVDISRWRKGIYFVTIDRPGMKLVEKLIVE